MLIDSDYCMVWFRPIKGRLDCKFISFGESVLLKLTPVCAVQASLEKPGKRSWKLLLRLLLPEQAAQLHSCLVQL
jgi:hypothetical protein